MLDGSELCQVQHNLDAAAVLAGPGQGATVLVDAAAQQQQQQQKQKHDEQVHSGSTSCQPAVSDDVDFQSQVQAELHSKVQEATSGIQEEFLALLEEGLAFDVQAASAEQRIAAAAALAAASAARGSSGDILTTASSSSSSSSAGSLNGGHFHYKGGVLRDKAGVDVSRHLSEVKRVSAVMNVDPQEFKRYLLAAFRQ
jgi:hypothetical protein